MSVFLYRIAIEMFFEEQKSINTHFKVAKNVTKSERKLILSRDQSDCMCGSELNGGREHVI